MLESVIGTSITLQSFLLCTAVSLVLGIGLAFVAGYRQKTSSSFAVTLALLPAVVQLVIMLVNGNIGTGVAVAGAFSLVRFRSAPGTAREIGVLFLAMALGLATGMGLLWLAVLAFVLLAGALLGLTALGFGEQKTAARVLKITIPESLDYDGLFDDIFAQYTRRCILTRVKTSNMGTLYELEYCRYPAGGYAAQGLFGRFALPQRQFEHHLRAGEQPRHGAAVKKDCAAGGSCAILGAEK